MFIRLQKNVLELPDWVKMLLLVGMTVLTLTITVIGFTLLMGVVV